MQVFLFKFCPCLIFSLLHPLLFPFSSHRLAPVFSLFVPFYRLIPRMPVTQVLGYIDITNKSLVYIVGLQVSPCYASVGMYVSIFLSLLLFMNSWKHCFPTCVISIVSVFFLLLWCSCWLLVPSCGSLHSVDWWVAKFFLLLLCIPELYWFWC